MIQTLILISSCLFTYTLALDLELAQEGPCLNLTALPLDPSIFKNESSKWYTPLLSKYELYRFVEEVTHKKAEDISEQELKSICPSSVSDMKGKLLVTESVGAGGYFAEYEVGTDSEDPNIVLLKVKGRKDWDAKFYVTHVEKDYFVGVSCWSNGQKSWSANSYLKKLSDIKKQTIFTHVKSLGFMDEKYYYEYNYDNCDTTIKTAYCLKDCMDMA